MSDNNFGQYVKDLRVISGKGSRELSRLLGTAETYISQLERGLIKKPDHKIATRLLKVLKVEKNEIEHTLNRFGIIDPIDEEKAIRNKVQRFNKSEEPNEDTEEFSTWLDVKKDEIKSINRKNYQIFNVLINSDVTRAEVILNEISNLLQNENNFIFFYNLLQIELSKLNGNLQKELLQLIQEKLKEDK